MVAAAAEVVVMTSKVFSHEMSVELRLSYKRKTNANLK